MPSSLRPRKEWIPILALLGLLTYAWARIDQRWYDNYFLLVVILLGGLPLLYQTTRAALHRHFNVDLIAIASIFAGLAIGQYLPAAVIVLMMSGGQSLEAYALRRASGALDALMKQSPRRANRWNGQAYEEVAVETVKIGDQLLVKPGESVPVDARIQEGSSELNESLLTGESVPQSRGPEAIVIAGSLNQTGPLTVIATTSAQQSTFAKIMQLVQEAEKRKAPIQQIADRFGVWFTPLTFLLVALTWLFTHNPVQAYAVLVIATPCPLILATPIAIIAGVGRAARQGIIVKSGAALEGMAKTEVLLFDKTGTLTKGQLTLSDVHLHSTELREDQALQLAASLEQYSNHVVARSLVEIAAGRRLPLLEAKEVQEIPSRGLYGLVDEKPVLIGNVEFLAEQRVRMGKLPKENPGEIQLLLARAGELLAVFHLVDSIRPESRQVVAQLHQEGVYQIIMLSGDQREVAERIARQVGITEVVAEVDPSGKLAELEKRTDRTVMMVGDGINDAPALERADIGVALARQGGEVAVEAADVVLLNERLERLPVGIHIGKQVLMIAGQGIWFGMLASFMGMGAAAFGYLPPVEGAVLQEVVDVLVIINALRVLRV